MANSTNQTIFVAGITEFSSIGSVIKGERLKRLQERRGSNYPLAPQTNLTITNARVLPANHKSLNEIEQHVQSRFFHRNSDPTPNINHFEAVSKVYQRYNNGKQETIEEALSHYRLPWVAVTTPKSKTAHQYLMHKNEELEPGQKCILCLRSFQGQQGRPGLVLNGVLVYSANPDKPATRNFGTGSNIANDLAALGLVLDNPQDPEENDQPARTIRESELPTGMQNIKTDNSAAPMSKKDEDAERGIAPSDIPAPTDADVPAEPTQPAAQPEATKPDPAADNDADVTNSWFRN